MRQDKRGRLKMFDYIILTVGTNYQLPCLIGSSNFLSCNWNSRIAPAQRHRATCNVQQAAGSMQRVLSLPLFVVAYATGHASFAFGWRHATFVLLLFKVCLLPVCCQSPAATVVAVISCNQQLSVVALCLGYCLTVSWFLLHCHLKGHTVG